MNKLNKWDIDLFLTLNGLHLDWLDPIMIAFSARFTWIPLYFILLFLLYKKFDKKLLGIIILLVVGLIFIADQSSVHLFKNFFQRLRPCYNESIVEKIHLLKHCGGQYGFVSSHAANTFALALFIGNLLNKKWIIGLLFWSALVSYSRIYLGVHYPADILCGAILGIIIAVVFNLIYNKLTLSLNKE